MIQTKGFREVCFDTETTGLDAKNGDRIIEIACVELVDHLPTGKIFYCLINPERSIAQEAIEVHGITNQMVLDKPKFKEVYKEFVEFIADSPLIAHNAPFDVSFVNEEFKKLNIDPLENTIIDTLTIAQRKFPNGNVNLDALCRKFKIDISKRTKHSALLDTKLLAEVYLQLMGGRLRSFDFQQTTQNNLDDENQVIFRTPRNLGLATQEDLNNHLEFLKKIKSSLWSENVIEQDSSSSLKM